MDLQKFCDKLKEILRELGESKKIFCNEYQFQFALILKIKDKLKIDAMSEVPFCNATSDNDNVSNNRYDILAWLNEQDYVAIELKYKTAAANIGDTKLKQHNAHDIGCFDFLHDVERLENLCSGKNLPYELEEKNCVGGMALLLTNDKLYSEPSNKKSQYDNFKLKHGGSVNGDLEWVILPERLDAFKRQQPLRSCGIKLKKFYTFEWEKYCDVGNETFKYLLLSV